jgi:hypothetical protein
MTNAEMKLEIETSAFGEYHGGGDVTINNMLPTVSVVNSNGDEYFFQGHEAEELLAEAEAAADKFDVTPEDYLMMASQGW